MTKSNYKENIIGSIIKIHPAQQDPMGVKLVQFNFVHCYTKSIMGLACEVTKDYYVAEARGKEAEAVLALKEGTEVVVTGRVVGEIFGHYPVLKVESVKKSRPAKEKVVKKVMVK